MCYGILGCIINNVWSNFIRCWNGLFLSNRMYVIYSDYFCIIRCNSCSCVFIWNVVEMVIYDGCCYVWDI